MKASTIFWIIIALIALSYLVINIIIPVGIFMIKLAIGLLATFSFLVAGYIGYRIGKH